MLTRMHVRDMVAAVVALVDDPEGAHLREDEMREIVLKAIARGTCEDPQGCAEEAMKTSGLDFPRWYG